MAELKTTYLDDILDVSTNERRKYQMITNDDGTVSFVDVTDYTQVGDSFGAKDINSTNEAINDFQADVVTLQNRTDGMLKPVLLWTNPDITAEFPAQTIPLDLTEYEGVTFRFKSSWEGIFHEPLVATGGSGRALAFLNTTSKEDAVYLSTRTYSVSGTGVSFGDAQHRPLTRITDTIHPVTQNTNLIPHRIYGYKKTT